MKRIILTSVAILLGLVINAQTPFEKAIKESLLLLDSAKTTEDLQAVAGRFERISMTETTRWEPVYHLAYVQINISFREKDNEKKDAILDLAEKNIEKAFNLNGDKSELFALQGFVYQARIQGSMTRAMTYSPKAAEILEKAVQENPENPRALFLLAQNIYYTPAMFGGGAKNALPKYIAAKEKFEKESKSNVLGPVWGEKINLRMIDTCSKEN